MIDKKSEPVDNIEIIEHYKELNQQCDQILEKIKKRHKKKETIIKEN